MPKLSKKARREIYKKISESLPFYREWKAGQSVPELALPYLELLDPHVSSYLGALDRLEEDCVDFYLSGWSIDRIVKLNYFVKARVNRYTVKRWVFGTQEYDGLVNTMMQVFLKNFADFCPFCHGNKFGPDSGFRPRLSGSVCPHREIEEHEKMSN